MTATSDSLVRDRRTGQLQGSEARTLQERYPTGRKHCTCCGRWRHLIDFSPRKGNPQPWCHYCNNRRNRYDRLRDRLERDAPNRARAVVTLLAAELPPRSKPSRSEVLRARREWWAQWIAVIRADPELHQEYLETARMRSWESRRKAGKAERPRRRKPEHSSELVNPTLFLEWLSWQDAWLTNYEIKIIRNYKKERTEGLSVEMIDRIMTRVGATDQFAIFDDAGWPAPPENDQVAA